MAPDIYLLAKLEVAPLYPSPPTKLGTLPYSLRLDQADIETVAAKIRPYRLLKISDDIISQLGFGILLLGSLEAIGHISGHKPLCLIYLALAQIRAKPALIALDLPRRRAITDPYTRNPRRLRCPDDIRVDKLGIREPDAGLFDNLENAVDSTTPALTSLDMWHNIDDFLEMTLRNADPVNKREAPLSRSVDLSVKTVLSRLLPNRDLSLATSHNEAVCDSHSSDELNNTESDKDNKEPRPIKRKRLSLS
ncbi:hypothetical protein G7Y89_g4703 [Cudoniella acicularis]|uniref:Uncharacterized protein n=1 Tax=Cudoniella acicularis TaxID=354080 RepID=A0A8H4RNW8_9HELO|nr:hypothetical protein G7Y89_g4703 [Cudoniella acicularis]